MQAVELETTIDQDGTLHLPEQYRFTFGAKARVIVLLTEVAEESQSLKGQADALMKFSGTIDWPIADPMEFQRKLRSEWGREWD